MKPLKATWIIIFVGILLTVAGIDLGGSIAAKAEEMNGPVSMNKVVVSAKNQTGTSSSSAFTPDEIRGIEERLNTYAAFTAVSGYTVNSAETDSTSYSVHVSGTNWRFPEFFGLNFRYGGYFTQKAEDEGAACVVIDEALAWNLFKTEDAVGRTVKIYGVPFKITGILKTDESAGQFLTDTGIPQVYIPAGKMLELDPTARISSLQIKTAEGGASDKNVTDMNNALMQAGKSPSDYNIADYNIKAVQLEQRPRILVFIAGFAAMLLLFGFLVRTMADIVKTVREGLKSDYFANVIKSSSKPLTSAAIKIVLLLACIAVLWLLSSFRLYIPPEYIPDDLTNLQYYVSLIKTDIKTGMAGLGLIPSRTELLTDTMESLSNWIFYITLIAGSILSYLGFTMLKAFTPGRTRTAVYCGLFLLSSVILVSAAALFLGMPQSVYLNGMAVLWTLIFILIQKNERNVDSNA